MHSRRKFEDTLYFQAWLITYIKRTFLYIWSDLFAIKNRIREKILEKISDTWILVYKVWFKLGLNTSPKALLGITFETSLVVNKIYLG